ncbi:HNH endonuclease [Caballeronia sordidicola]|uniref:HNH endonuclease n=1 Tax=Caballeronia sordidicola TaxID=196367 RepID=UPI00094DB5DE
MLVSTSKRIRARDNNSCQVCQARVSPGMVVHIVPTRRGGSEDDSNLKLLCDECFRLKRAKDAGHRVKTGVDVNGMPLDPDHHWNK